MTWENDVGHRETISDLPYPTAPPRVWSLASLGLPAVVLSLASFGATIAVFCLVQASRPLRALFRLPWPVGVSALAAMVVGGIVVWGCRHRPGRRLPRYWAVGLTAGMGLLVLYSLVDPVAEGAPWCHAAALGGFAGALVLVPRLVRVGPDRRWVEAVAPVSLAGTLLVLSPVLGFARWSYLREIHRLDETMAVARSLGSELATSIPRAHTDSDTELEALDRRLNALSQLSFKGRSDPRNLWQTAVILGREDELGQGLARFARDVVDGLDPRTAPRVSSLDEAAVRWDPEAKKWISGSGFVRLSDRVGTYYARLGSLFTALDPRRIEGTSPSLESYRERYRRERARLRGHLRATQEEWADQWAVARVPGVSRLVDPVQPSLARLLQLPLVTNELDTLAPADLPKLLALDVEQARDLAAEVPGCHVRRYREEDSAYERVDCESYAPATEGTLGAELRVEMRLVFVKPGGLDVHQDQRPTEVFFLFPVPEDQSEIAYLDEVAKSVADAVAARWDGGLRLLDRSGSALDGFALEGAAQPVVVYRPRLVPFLQGRKAVVVRAERSRA